MIMVNPVGAVAVAKPRLAQTALVPARRHGGASLRRGRPGPGIRLTPAQAGPGLDNVDTTYLA